MFLPKPNFMWNKSVFVHISKSPTMAVTLLKLKNCSMKKKLLSQEGWILKKCTLNRMCVKKENLLGMRLILTTDLHPFITWYKPEACASQTYNFDKCHPTSSTSGYNHTLKSTYTLDITEPSGNSVESYGVEMYCVQFDTEHLLYLQYILMCRTQVEAVILMHCDELSMQHPMFCECLEGL